MSATDTSFESAFSEIAHTVLRENAPALMEHLVGFQILDKDDNETRAVGVFGFKIHNQWFYAPVFFLNGALKGTELLYVKDQDLFIPLQDNWVSYLISKKPQLLGSAEEQDESELDISVPRFNDFVESPDTNSFKWASVKNRYADWVDAFIPAYADAILDKKAYDNNLSLDKALQKSPAMAAALAESLQSHTKLAEAVLDYYGDLDFLPSPDSFVSTDVGGEGRFDFLKASADGDTKIKDTAPQTVKAYTVDDMPEAIQGDGGTQLLTEKEKEDLMQGKVVIKDNRPEENKSRVYNVDFEEVLQNPTETGVYSVLNVGGKFVEALVITAPKTIGAGTTGGVSTIITDDGECSNAYTKDIFTTSAETEVKGFKDKFKKYYDKGVGFEDLKDKHYYVAITPDGIGTIPFKVKDKYTGNDGTKTVSVGCMKTGIIDPVKADWSYLDRGYDGINRGIEVDNEYSDRIQILITPKEITKDIENTNETMVATDRVKFIDIGYDTEGYIMSPGETSGTKPTGKKFEEFIPGSFQHAEQHIMKQGAEQVELFTTGSDLVIRHENGTQRFKKSAAVADLVCTWGVDVNSADTMVKEASKSITQYWIKKAQPMMESNQTAPAFPGYATGYDSDIDATLVEDQQDFLPVDGMGEPSNAQEEYDLMRDPEVQKVLEAAKTGKKEVFDTTVVSNLVKLIDVDGMVDSFLPDIIRGMDRIGRILFLFYWHAEEFKDRYGRQEIVDLEDSLRNVFKATGDLVVFLKQQSVTSDPIEETLSVDIGEIT